MSDLKKSRKQSVATIRESKSGNLYLNIDTDLSLSKGDKLFINSKEESLKFAVKNGHLTQERADELLEQYGYIKYELYIPEKK